MGPTEKGIATPVARQSHAPISKYASKYVGSVMNHLTEELLISREDHPKSTQKWLAKACVSIQKKVSLASRTAFCEPKQDRNSLICEINKLQQKIQGQISRIRSTAISSMSDLCLSEVLQRSKAAHYTAGYFAPHVEKINDQFKLIGKNLEGLSRDLPDRVDKLGTTVEIAEEKLETFIPAHAEWSLKMRIQIQESSAEGSTTLQAPLDRLRNHLHDE